MDNISITYDKHINDPRSLRFKVTFSSRPFMHPCPGDWVAIEYVVVYFAQGAHEFSAGIKCWHYTVTVISDFIYHKTKKIHYLKVPRSHAPLKKSCHFWHSLKWKMVILSDCVILKFYPKYSTDILFLHQSTGCLSVHKHPLDVCQCLVAQTPMDNLSRSKPIISIDDTRSLRAFSSCISRSDVCQYPVVQTPLVYMSKKQSTSMIHEACKTKPRSVMRSSVHPCPDN